MMRASGWKAEKRFTEQPEERVDVVSIGSWERIQYDKLKGFENEGKITGK